MYIMIFYMIFLQEFMAGHEHRRTPTWLPISCTLAIQLQLHLLTHSDQTHYQNQLQYDAIWWFLSVDQGLWDGKVNRLTCKKQLSSFAFTVCFILFWAHPWSLSRVELKCASVSSLSSNRSNCIQSTKAFLFPSHLAHCPEKWRQGIEGEFPPWPGQHSTAEQLRCCCSNWMVSPPTVGRFFHTGYGVEGRSLQRMTESLGLALKEYAESWLNADAKAIKFLGLPHIAELKHQAMGCYGAVHYLKTRPRLLTWNCLSVSHEHLPQGSFG